MGLARVTEAAEEADRTDLRDETAAFLNALLIFGLGRAAFKILSDKG